MKNIDNTKVYNAYSYHRRGGTVRLLGSMTMPSNTKNLRGWLHRCFDIGSSVDTVIIDTVPPTVVPMGCGSQRAVYLISEYVGKPGKEKLAKSYIVDSGSVDAAVMSIARSVARGSVTIKHNEDYSEYTMIDGAGKSHIWTVQQKSTYKPDPWQQPCWECMHAVPASEGAEEVRGCPWSRSFSEVPGWDAVRVEGEDTYEIVKCPMFVRG